MTKKIIEWINQHKVLVAIVALVLLVGALVWLRNPVTAFGAAVAAGFLILLKEILAGVGMAKAADELDKLEDEQPQPLPAEIKKRRARIEKSKRSFDVWSSICGMFAAIAGVPAAVAVVEQLVQ